MSLTDTFKDLASKIQTVHTDIIKLVLLKRLRPILRPTKYNIRMNYNIDTGRTERVFIPDDPDDHIPAYYYRLTKRALGWNGDVVTPVTIKNRIIKQNFPLRRPYTSKQTKPRAQITYAQDSLRNDAVREKLLRDNNKNVLDVILQRSTLQIISNLEDSYEYYTFIPYKDIRPELRYIGQDILSQTQQNIDPGLSLRLTTGRLRVSLSQLDGILDDLTEDQFTNFVKMNKLLNSINKDNIPKLIRLLATLEVTPWNDLTDAQRCDFINTLGQCFIDEFNNNQLITDLLAVKQSELILTTSYMYTVTKLLFFVFGYDLLATPPPISDSSPPLMGSGFRTTCVPEGCADPDGLEYVNIFYNFWPSIGAFMDARCPPCCAERTVNCGCVVPSYDGTCSISDMLWRFYDYAYCVFLEDVKKRRVPNAAVLKINRQIQILTDL
jgi:hypothetical protein